MSSEQRPGPLSSSLPSCVEVSEANTVIEVSSRVGGGDAERPGRLVPVHGPVVGDRQGGDQRLRRQPLQQQLRSSCSASARPALAGASSPIPPRSRGSRLQPELGL